MHSYPPTMREMPPNRLLAGRQRLSPPGSALWRPPSPILIPSTPKPRYLIKVLIGTFFLVLCSSICSSIAAYPLRRYKTILCMPWLMLMQTRCAMLSEKWTAPSYITMVRLPHSQVRFAISLSWLEHRETGRIQGLCKYLSANPFPTGSQSEGT
jgi:ABC-type glycerol-3-phosphate transport system permease component